MRRIERFDLISSKTVNKLLFQSYLAKGSSIILKYQLYSINMKIPCRNISEIHKFKPHFKSFDTSFIN